jgi:hypothetical protein
MFSYKTRHNKLEFISLIGYGTYSFVCRRIAQLLISHLFGFRRSSCFVQTWIYVCKATKLNLSLGDALTLIWHGHPS